MTKSVDPWKVAKLPHAEFSDIQAALKLMDVERSERRYPADLQVRTFHILRHIGLNVRTFDEMHLAFHQIKHRMILIERLRTSHFGPH